MAAMVFSQSDIAREFQHRRRLTFQRLKHWIVLMIIGFLSCIIITIGTINSDHDLMVLIFIALMVPTGTAVIAINLIISRYYRCPVCDRIPYTSGMSGGLPLDPKACPHCGALFR
jgi:hypothetical protein